MSSHAYLLAGQKVINDCLASYTQKEDEVYKQERKKLKDLGKEVKINDRVAPPVSCFDKKFPLNEAVQTFLSNMQDMCAAVTPEKAKQQKMVRISKR